MIVKFLLPTPGNNPVGGYKVVYEYANGLVELGHTVEVIHPIIKVPNANCIRQYLRFVKSYIKKDWLPTSWFNINKKVKMRLVMDISEQVMGEGSAVIATSWETAEVVAKLPGKCGKKFYFIQHFEEWSGDKDRVLATWKLPLQKIVIAKWLQDIATNISESSFYIPNGVDFSAFDLDSKIEDRDPYSVVMLYHDFDWKGSNDGINALRLVKNKYPSLQVNLFGVPKKPDGLEPWFNYYQLPSQTLLRSLYNKSAIFISPSWAEGWPLPPAEAMICGSATVLTDIGGHREYGIDGVTTTFAEVKNPEDLTSKICNLLSDREKLISQALNAKSHISQFTWKRAITEFEKVIS